MAYCYDSGQHMDIAGETEVVSREQVLSLLCRIVVSGSVTRDQRGSSTPYIARSMEDTMILGIGMSKLR